jgi:DNA-binding PadR family transcriptional regulator
MVPMTRPLNATAASLLGFLHEGPRSGWDLVQVAQERIGDFWTLTQSQVYRELVAMAEAGLVEAGARESRARQPYTITAAGREAFAEWLERDPGEETIRFPLLLALSFGRHLPPERIATFMARHREVHATRLRAYEEQQSAADASQPPPDPYRLAALDFGIGYERAVIEWFDRQAGRLPGGDE